ncbi:NUDIX hydrolase [Pseudomaricurvus sp.]|uniref:NUDIX hydrolase n=1 Tax=Pseudomaricurvus sp. TaxID=2004510 RepID=UPI003F6B137A
MSEQLKVIDLETPVPAHPAATVILLRPAADGFEVLLLLRAQAIKFAGGSWVFPGGRIEADDAPGKELDSWEAARMGAARECLEESGLTVDPASFIPYSHWTTPKAESKRFSTWFLIGSLDEDADVIVDDGEIVDYQWLTPAAALEKHRQQQLSIMPPAYLTLLELSKVSSIQAAKAFAHSRKPPFYQPKMVKDDRKVCILYGDDAGYASGNPQVPGARNRITQSDCGWQHTRR